MKSVLIVLLLLSASVAWPEAPPTGYNELETPPSPAVKKQVKKSKGKAKSEKETEGTEAKDRFQADPVSKSQYKLNGENLEVDPD